ncbi:E3 ubiquitin-protein ligase MARCHF3-like [Anthonomus grandis grandis]|uniref:E3 ubiquitin-protein ligase MARCHF3-like n=1 Tax=Anthonomus grandis grandis TaxID=2921223 RepID=UPI002165C6A2|nr:E3 ubiquitin-protein ligase MARCHF3-like [Anthonomus grandis grandis]
MDDVGVADSKTNTVQSKPGCTKNINNPLALVHKLSVASVHCRICYDNEKEEDLIAPCHCKGTVAFVHRSCLETWLGESGTSICELCHQYFKTERTPKFSSVKSIWQWLRYGHSYPGTGVRSDIVACAIITPLAILVTYICLYSSEYYSQQKFSQIPAAKWTSISLLIMISVMLFGYYLWVHSVIRLHARMWYSWWQRTCVVRYIPPSTVSLHARVDEQSMLVPNNTPNPLLRNEQDVSGSESASVINFESVINIETPTDMSQGEGVTIKREPEVVIDLVNDCSSEFFDLK